MVVNLADIGRLKVTELKAELTQLGLPVNGKEVCGVLLVRLQFR